MKSSKDPCVPGKMLDHRRRLCRFLERSLRPNPSENTSYFLVPTKVLESLKRFLFSWILGKIITSETILPEPGPGSINTRTITNTEDVNSEKVSDAMHSVRCNSDSSHAGFCLKTWTSIRIHLPEGILPIPHPTGTRTSGRPGSSVETGGNTLGLKA